MPENFKTRISFSDWTIIGKLPGRSDIGTGWGVGVSRVEMAGKIVFDKAMNRRMT